MKNVFTMLFLTVVIFGCKKVNQEEKPKANDGIVTKKEAISDWIILFDGTSYDNWRGYLTDDMYSEWTIEDSAMVFTPSEEGGRNIITKDTYTNFVLSLEWKISEGGNSGVFWSVFEDPKYNEAYQTGPEIQVLDNERHPDAKANPKFHQAGALYDLVQPEQDVCKPAGEWNLCVLSINHKTNQGSVTLNGTEIVKFPVHGEEWDALVDNSKFKGWEGFGEHQTGHIGLQDHSDKVWFKNIKIKNL